MVRTLSQRRIVENDSSGFEHVFVGEEKDGVIVGLHNWIQMYQEEKKGNFNYMGYIKPKPQNRGVSYMSPSENEQLITVQVLTARKITACTTVISLHTRISLHMSRSLAFEPMPSTNTVRVAG